MELSESFKDTIAELRDLKNSDVQVYASTIATLNYDESLMMNDSMDELKLIMSNIVDVIKHQTAILSTMLDNFNEFFGFERENRLDAARSNTLADLTDNTDTITHAQASDTVEGTIANENTSHKDVFGGTLFGNLAAGMLGGLGGKVKMLFGALMGIKGLLIGGGLIGAVVLMSDVFDRIGNNPAFNESLGKLKEVWSNKVMPLFERIVGIFEGFGDDGGLFDKMEDTLGKLWSKIEVPLTEGITSILDTFTTAIEDIVDSVNMMLDGDFLGGMKHLISGMGTFLLDTFDIVFSKLMEMFGVDFGEDGSLFGLIQHKWSDFVTGFFDMFDSTIAHIKDVFTFDPSESKFENISDIIFAPINMAINLVRDIFGWESDEMDASAFSLQDYISGKGEEAMDWVVEKFDSVWSTLKDKLGAVSDFISSIPEQLKLFAQESWINIKAGFLTEFAKLGNWMAMIPANIKLHALESMKDTRGLGWLVSDNAISDAQATVESKTVQLTEELTKIENIRVREIEAIGKAAEDEAKAKSAPPQTVIYEGSKPTDARTFHEETHNMYMTHDPGLRIDPSRLTR